jgi:hypothetical protein
LRDRHCDCFAHRTRADFEEARVLNTKMNLREKTGDKEYIAVDFRDKP